MNSGKDISVVVQGPVHGASSAPFEERLTKQALDSVRRIWPDAEIILSTWRGADLVGLNCDQIVENDDPGGISEDDPNPKKPVNNLNRQIVSTRNGLACATRQFAIKLRSDCSLDHPTDISLLDRVCRSSHWCLLQKPIIALNVYSRHPLRRPLLFHLSDLFQAGLTTDLQRLWSASLVEGESFTHAVDPKRPPFVNAFPGENYLFRCSSEQYVVEQFLQPCFPEAQLRFPSDGSCGLLELWLRVLANNFVMLTPAEAGVAIPRKMRGHETQRDLFVPADRKWLQAWTKLEPSWRISAIAKLRYQFVRLIFGLLGWVPTHLFGGRLP